MKSRRIPTASCISRTAAKTRLATTRMSKTRCSGHSGSVYIYLVLTEIHVYLNVSICNPLPTAAMCKVLSSHIMPRPAMSAVSTSAAEDHDSSVFWAFQPQTVTRWSYPAATTTSPTHWIALRADALAFETPRPWVVPSRPPSPTVKIACAMHWSSPPLTTWKAVLLAARMLRQLTPMSWAL
ncbi:hypothetical protein ACHHYP_05512 [Achlya hypogyna]|uniref:Uncharacterized protein n=1 Tax=Achlya hypogyna TaxID=1202772 RepID=A0A1V9YXL2_ACHHY|nr:hypothetical protein ACHHYP_05512 [Achlya hypogyna]